MSKETYTPIVDSYRNSVDLPEHIKEYTQHPYDEAELRGLGRLNREYEGVFTEVNSNEFEEAYKKFAQRVNAAWKVARELTSDLTASDDIKAAQIREATIASIDEAALDESQKLLPLQNPEKPYPKEEYRVYSQRVALEELFKKVVAFSPDGHVITDTPAYKQLLQHWRRYEQLGFAFEVGRLREQAIRQDKKNFKPKDHLEYARGVAYELNIKSQGLFGRIRNLPVDRYHIPKAGGETSYRKIASKFKDQMERSESQAEKRTAEQNQLALYTLADNEIEPLMRALENKYRADGLPAHIADQDNPPSIDEELDANRVDLQDWLVDDELREMFFDYDNAANVYDARSRN